MSDVVDFQQEAKLTLKLESPESSTLEKLLDVGMSFDIDLPEIPSLKQVCSVFNCFGEKNWICRKCEVS